MEGIMTTMQRKHENEVADLHASVDRLLKVGFNHTNVHLHLLCISTVNKLCNDGIMFSYVMKNSVEST